MARIKGTHHRRLGICIIRSPQITTQKSQKSNIPLYSHFYMRVARKTFRCGSVGETLIAPGSGGFLMNISNSFVRRFSSSNWRDSWTARCAANDQEGNVRRSEVGMTANKCLTHLASLCL